MSRSPAPPPSHDPGAAPDEALADRLRASRVMHDAPEAVVQRAIDLFVARAPARPAPALLPRLRRLVATLVLDSIAAPPVAHGLRAGAAMEGAGDVRQMLFSAEGRDIDLRILALDADGGSWRLSGQVLGPDAAGESEVQLPDGRRTAVPWNDLAEFSFGRIDASRCRLTLRSADWEIELPEIEFGRACA